MHAADALRTDSGVAALAFDHPGAPKSLDDIVVEYAQPRQLACGRSVDADYMQVKFRVDATAQLTVAALTDSTFINATSSSFLERACAAWRHVQASGRRGRFTLVSTAPFAPNDRLAELVWARDGSLRFHLLEGDRAPKWSAKILADWRAQLGLDEEELLEMLKYVRIQHLPGPDSLLDHLNRALELAGLQPYKVGALSHAYDDIPITLLKRDQTRFAPDALRAVLAKEGLVVGPPVRPSSREIIGVRSFKRGSDDMPTTTARHLCLVAYFDGRRAHTPDTWNNVVMPALAAFVDDEAKTLRPLAIRLEAHGAIAFAAGRLMLPKAGLDVVPLQSTPGRPGLRKQWDPVLDAWDGAAETWEVEIHDVHSGGDELAVAVSATHDSTLDALTYAKRTLSSVGRLISLRLPEPSKSAVLHGAHARHLAVEAERAIRANMRQWERGRALHLLGAAPNGLWFVFGQETVALGSVQFHEYEGFATNELGGYTPAIRC